MMLNKRGIGHHIDWIIGTSIFLLYIVFVIVTLKPGVRPLNEGDVLLNMIQDNFIANVSRNITKVPLVIDGGCTVSKTDVSTVFSYENNGKIGVYTKLGDIVDFGFSSGNLIISFGIEDTKREYKILYSTDPLFNGNISYLLTEICSEDDTNYIYGVPELLKGLSDTRIGHLKTYAETNYEQLKDDWGYYPKTSDFSITVEKNGNTQEIIDKEAPANANVYVRQLVEFYLEDTGEKIPVKVIIKVW